MSAYNQQHEAPPEQENTSRCRVAGCPMIASLFLDGGPWSCRYHAKQPVNIGLKITELLKQNKRWFKIIEAADDLSAAEYDDIQLQGTFELDGLIIPLKGENHKKWVLRTKETIYRALKDQINKIAEANDAGGWSYSAASVRDLTNGSLLKKVKYNKQNRQ